MHRSASIEKVAKRTRNLFSDNSEVIQSSLGKKQNKTKNLLEKSLSSKVVRNVGEVKMAKKVTETTFWQQKVRH